MTQAERLDSSKKKSGNFLDILAKTFSAVENSGSFDEFYYCLKLAKNSSNRGIVILSETILLSFDELLFKM